MYIILLLTAFSLAECFVEDGVMNPQIPTVVLTGQPRIIGRRIWRGQEMEQVVQHIQQREPPQQPIDVKFAEGPVEGRPVTVYRRILRPARLVYLGGDVVTSQWLGGDENMEREAFHRLPYASAMDAGFHRIRL